MTCVSCCIRQRKFPRSMLLGPGRGFQADNCSREVKNVGTLRLLSMWIALRKLGGAEVSSSLQTFLLIEEAHQAVAGGFAVGLQF